MRSRCSSSLVHTMTRNPRSLSILFLHQSSAAVPQCRYCKLHPHISQVISPVPSFQCQVLNGTQGHLTSLSISRTLNNLAGVRPWITTWLSGRTLRIHRVPQRPTLAPLLDLRRTRNQSIMPTIPTSTRTECSPAKVQSVGHLSLLLPLLIKNEIRVSVAEKYNVRRKPCLDLADMAADEMPKCSTPDGEETEVHIMSVGRPPRSRSRSRSRSHSRSHARTNSLIRTIPSSDLEAGTPSETPEEPTSGGFVSKVMAVFRSNNSNSSDEEAAGTSSVIVSVQMETEEHIDPVQDPRFDPEQQRWRNLKRASVVGQKGTGI